MQAHCIFLVIDLFCLLTICVCHYKVINLAVHLNPSWDVVSINALFQRMFNPKIFIFSFCAVAILWMLSVCKLVSELYVYIFIFQKMSRILFLASFEHVLTRKPMQIMIPNFSMNEHGYITFNYINEINFLDIC